MSTGPSNAQPRDNLKRQKVAPSSQGFKRKREHDENGLTLASIGATQDGQKKGEQLFNFADAIKHKFSKAHIPSDEASNLSDAQSTALGRLVREDNQTSRETPTSRGTSVTGSDRHTLTSQYMKSMDELNATVALQKLLNARREPKRTIPAKRPNVVSTREQLLGALEERSGLSPSTGGYTGGIPDPEIILDNKRHHEGQNNTNPYGCGRDAALTTWGEECALEDAEHLRQSIRSGEFEGYDVFNVSPNLRTQQTADALIRAQYEETGILPLVTLTYGIREQGGCFGSSPNHQISPLLAKWNPIILAGDTDLVNDTEDIFNSIPESHSEMKNRVPGAILNCMDTSRFISQQTGKKKIHMMNVTHANISQHLGEALDGTPMSLANGQVKRFSINPSTYTAGDGTATHIGGYVNHNVKNKRLSQGYPSSVFKGCETNESTLRLKEWGHDTRVSTRDAETQSGSQSDTQATQSTRPSSTQTVRPSRQARGYLTNPWMRSSLRGTGTSIGA